MNTTSMSAMGKRLGLLILREIEEAVRISRDCRFRQADLAKTLKLQAAWPLDDPDLPLEADQQGA